MCIGDEGYAGQVKSIWAVEEPVIVEGSRPVSLTNEKGVAPGWPRFRLGDEEVQDVFVLEAVEIEDWEVTPGVTIPVHGWRGGKVYDYAFDSNGWLRQGHVIVGPHPDTDVNDVVHWSADKGWSDLHAQVPGPALRFGFLRNTRVYMANSLSGHHVSNLWHGLDVPYDQSFMAVSPGNTVVYEFVNHNVGSLMYSSHPEAEITAAAGLSGPIIIDYPDVGMSADREYVAYIGAVEGANVLGGNTFPGTARRLSGWYRDVMAISSSERDLYGNTIVHISDSPRPPVANSDSDPLHPAVAHECPANGGPLIGRVGTGCVKDGVHVNGGHQITSTTLRPGTQVEIWDHIDYSADNTATINGQHNVVRINSTAFLVPRVGDNGAFGGVGGFVAVWRLHKADPEDGTAQNNGASGAYFRFNYGEKVLLKFFNSHGASVPMHIHGHQWAVWAEDGNLLDFPFAQQEVTVAGGSGVDVLVVANNPNRYGSWLLTSTDSRLLSFDNHPWPDAASNPGGLMSFVDYTGKRQGALAVDDEMWVQSFWKLPPVCKVESPEITLHVDHRGYGYDHSQWLRLVGLVEIRNGEYNTLTYSWTRDTTKPGASLPGRVFQDSNTEPWARVYGLKTGTYWFNFQATVQLKGRPATETITCPPVAVKVTVVATESNTLPSNVKSLAAPTKIHLADSDYHEVITAPDGTSFDSSMRAFPRGQATFPLYEGASKFDGTSVYHSFGTTRLYVENFDFATAGNLDALRFYRWPAAGRDVQNPDFWLNVPYDLTRSERQWTWAIKKAVIDSRITTYGFTLGTDLGRDVAALQTPPAVSRVVYPMWQGASVAGADFNSRHDVYFLILESSDKEFCDRYGCVYTPTLATVPFEALNEVSIYPLAGQPSVRNPTVASRVNSGTFAHTRATEFVFNVDPPQLPINPTTVDTGYSPLKHFRFVGADGVSRSVIANMPFIYWGLYQVQSNTLPLGARFRDERKMLLVDSGDCDRFIRSYPSNPTTDLWADNPTNKDLKSGFWNIDQISRTIDDTPRGGPPGCTSGSSVWRKQGGQLLDVPNWRKMYAIFKIHRVAGPAKTAGQFAYHSITDTSDYAEAQFHGIIYSPKLKSLGPAGRISAVAGMKTVANGVGQGAFISALPGSAAWTPFWHATTLYWNCGTYYLGTLNFAGDYQPVVFKDVINGDSATSFRDSSNRILLTPSAAATLYPATSTATDHYPLLANIKTSVCPEYTAMHTGRDSGVIYAGEEAALKAKGVLFETEQPGGSADATATSTTFVIFNSHVPLTFDAMAHRNEEDFIVDIGMNPVYDKWSQPAAVGTFPAQSATSADGVYLPGIWGFFRRTAIIDRYSETPKGYSNLFYAYFPIQDSDDSLNLWQWKSLWTVEPPATPALIPTAGGPYTNKLWLPVPIDWSIGINPVDWETNSYFYSGVGASARPTGATTAQPHIAFGALPAWNKNTDVKFTIVECDDSEFATVAKVAYTPALRWIEPTVTTWATYWNEPRRQLNGSVAPQDLSTALRSFVFYEAPPAMDAVAADPNNMYTPFKRFTFNSKVVTCNMPFFKWGAAANQQMKEESLTSDACLDASRPVTDCRPSINRSGREQVLASRTATKTGTDPSLQPLDFTVKIHRAVRWNDNQYPYFAIFDSSDLALAQYYGVPLSVRTARAGRADLSKGVSLMHIFQNGLRCRADNGTLGAACFNSKTRNVATTPEVEFQEPIAPAYLTSPIHQWAHLLWKCTAPYTGTSFAAFSSDEGVACPATVWDAYTKKIIESKAGVVYNGEVEKLIDEGRVWQIASAAAPMIVNSPFIATLTYPVVSISPPSSSTDAWALAKANGNTHVFYGTDSAKNWNYRMVTSSQFVENAYTILGTNVLVANVKVNGTAVPAVTYDTANVWVKPGDRVIFHILAGDYTPHGVVMAQQTTNPAADPMTAITNFFEINSSKLSAGVTFSTSTDGELKAFFGNNPYGFARAAFGPLHIFDGYVKTQHAGNALWFTSFNYGPQFMTGSLTVADY